MAHGHGGGMKAVKWFIGIGLGLVLILIIVGTIVVLTTGHRSSRSPNVNGQPTQVELLEQQLDETEVKADIAQVEAKIAKAEREKLIAQGSISPAAQSKPCPAPYQAPSFGQMLPQQRQVVADNTIYLTLDGQRQAILPLSTSDWSAPISIPVQPEGEKPVAVSFTVSPAEGFKALVLDAKSGGAYREVSVPKGGSLPVSGLRVIQLRGVQDGQQAVVTISR